MNGPRGQRAGRGFTIIEILVAILLLSTSLVAIFGAQFAAVSSANYARNLTQATQLGRCRMSELELLFQEEGFQEGDVIEGGTCCEFLDGEQETEFDCEWTIEMVDFPDMSQMMEEDEEGGDPESKLESVMGSSGLGGAGLGGAGMGMDDAGDMAGMGLDVISAILPMVTDLLEQAIRRVTVKVVWKEGSIEKDFVLVQYVTHPTQGPLKLMQEASAAEDVANEMKDRSTP